MCVKWIILINSLFYINNIFTKILLSVILNLKYKNIHLTLLK